MLTDRIPIFIVSRNRVTMARNLYEQCLKLEGMAPVLVDNDSHWKPFLDWILETDDLLYCSLPENLGCYAPWLKTPENQGRSIVEVFADMILMDYYVVTDDDLDISSVPADVFEVLKAGLDARPDVIKCGLSLKIDDLPDKYPFAREVRKDQSKYWTKPVEIAGKVYFEANIDTTFAMYRTADLDKIGPRAIGKGLRIDWPYMARHLPFYQAPEEWDEENWYYHENCNTYTYWSKLMQDYIAAKGILSPFRK